ncbi:type II toxin-antitoxin system HipA family toxin [Xanthobacter pseudotagetidis]|uniref:type II toxin-antitoxin system HipA family toxin n=1 Tax=Xanthobacter pseudotagetidis TaxID=3119911 RepID=UPI003728307F
MVAGLLTKEGGTVAFTYGRSYLARADAIALYLPELPLERGLQPPPSGLAIAGCIRDAAPDAWGRRVIASRLLSQRGADIDVDLLDELTYLLQSGSDRTGALDFQSSPREYVPRGESATASLDDLANAAELVMRGEPLPPGLDEALLHGSSIGGARPKAQITAGGRKLIAKFSLRSDVFDMVKGEFVAMRLAKRVGLDVAEVSLARAAGRDVLLVERFDRWRAASGWARRMMVSGLTLLGLGDMQGHYASYEDLCTQIRHRFDDPGATLRELFGRLVFNVLIGNTDDHARNHAAFWDGRALRLTPAYDICPMERSGGEASQAMFIHGRDRLSRLAACRAAAPGFLLSEQEADAVIAAQIQAIREGWEDACREGEVPQVERRRLWGRVVFNPFAFEGLPEPLARLGRQALTS